MTATNWQPPSFNPPECAISKMILKLFREIYPRNEHGDLADRIGHFLCGRLKTVWTEKAGSIRRKDLSYIPEAPLSRVAQKTVVIAYANSVLEPGRSTLQTLQHFLRTRLPAVGGLHILPPCDMSETRFNDGGFSQIRRDRIHTPFGTNQQFEAIMENHFSMTDFVLNHVDIDHPRFVDYLKGDDRAGRCFYVFTEEKYQKRVQRGDFASIFRPRPFPLFSIFRRKPTENQAGQTFPQQAQILNQHFHDEGLAELPEFFIGLLSVFAKIKNDQMLLEEDYRHLQSMVSHLSSTSPALVENIFAISRTQETRHTAYIFSQTIQTPADFLKAALPSIGIPADNADAYTAFWLARDIQIFGEPVRALTTFSHVQVDLNTSTFEGLQLLFDDLSWYLQMDLNMLRLDAANFAFKKWGTSCFGLPEVRKLLHIIYLAMDSVSPRMIPNLEVNAPLSAVLAQMADKQAPPPMMYDFHLACMLPVVFNTQDARPLLKIEKMAAQFDIPESSIRFSLDESHDGKSVNGSGGSDPLLTYKQRRQLVDTVRENGGHVKYKKSLRKRYAQAEWEKVCGEAGLDADTTARLLFRDSNKKNGQLHLKNDILTREDIARTLNTDEQELLSDPALSFFAEKILEGREPYELCITTRQALTAIDDPVLEVKRFMAFKTLAIGLMGRNVKALYFNDLVGLGNDEELVKETGELRNIKRTRSDRSTIEALIGSPVNPEYWIARMTNNLIALVDNDPAFHPAAAETRVVVSEVLPEVALLINRRENDHTIVIVNTSDRPLAFDFVPEEYGFLPNQDLFDNLTDNPLSDDTAGESVSLSLDPFARLWIKSGRVDIDPALLVPIGTDEEMEKALSS